MLSELKKSGKQIVLATSKPIVFADKILKHFNLYDFFDLTVGSNLDGSLTDKAEVIKTALEKLNIANKENIVMVGDRLHDIIGGKKNGCSPLVSPLATAMKMNSKMPVQIKLYIM